MDIIAKKYLKSVIFVEIIYENGGFMATVLEKANEISQQVINNFNLLTWQQQSEVASEINKILKMKRIRELENSVDSESMTIEEVVAIIKEERQKENEKK